MPRVPVVGRLFIKEYMALLGSLILVGLEGFLRVITLALPGPVIRFCYNWSRSLFNYLSSPQGKKSRTKKKNVVSSIAQASDFVDLCLLFGYEAEEHVVQTGDGYLLGLHRLAWRKGEEEERVNSGEGSLKKKVVYLHHGLLMNSEVWVCATEKERCLPFMLVERGYDVWLGNNRGNKYSKKSTRHTPTSTGFWDFSIDQFAFHDIPDSIDYILKTTHQPSLSYIGFSQGTAQAFATLSIHPQLNEKVDVFIALAPAMAPHGLSNGIVDALIKASPEVIFLAFGRRSILSSTTMWQALLYPPIFVRIIDSALSFLFAWSGMNIKPHQKLAAYPHLYSYTSTKSVVHWFQIIRTASFQMYDDEVQAPLSLTGGAKYTKVARFPTKNIKTPIVMVYGGSDSLVDIKVMLKELPRHTVATEIPHYEHLDFLWADDVDQLVFPHVFRALDTYTNADRPRRRISSVERSQPNLRAPGSASYFSDDRLGVKVPGSTEGPVDADAETDNSSTHGKSYAAIAADAETTPTGMETSPAPSDTKHQPEEAILSPSSTVPQSPRNAFDAQDFQPGTTDSWPSPETSRQNTSITEPVTPPRLASFGKDGRSGSVGSYRSTTSLNSEGAKVSRGGINVGFSRAAGGVISRGTEGLPDDKSTSRSKKKSKRKA
ncbi:alpha/beta-hydrolase [Xylona heveae TC161]|uniref:Alpha/beta-hydrolase n=1 Tax=Xylona heveae (strain CBS 132557 / TC161) TaxID=1328760 RepID=A0A165H6E9_XYLHT|nr:alpha/beta-hydrolase [Xylona heveae TC161]KZF23051.1 alpha/beta-hydrolase [Xylona heveae TC161]